MLNDLLELRGALARSGVAFETLHPNVKPMGRSAGVIVSINSQGFPASIEIADRDWMRDLFRIQRSNHWSFPGFNLPSLLSWDRDTPPAFVSIKGKADRQMEFLSEIRSLPASSRIVDLAATLQGQARDLQAARLDPGLEGRAFGALLERLDGVSDLPGFVEELRQAAVRLAKDRYATGADVIEGLLLGKWDARSGSFDVTKCPVFLDLQDATSFPRRVADPRLRKHLSDIESSLSASGGRQDACSLTGAVGAIETDKLPNPILPSLGATYLMSMNADAPCNARYGAEGIDIFPVSRSAAEQVNSALLWCVAKDRRGRTWAPSVPT